MGFSLGGFGDLFGGILGGIQGMQNQRDQRNAADWQKQKYDESLLYNRPNQTNPFGSINWTKDDKGNWTQTGSLNPADQARLDQYRDIASKRMAGAGGIDLSRYAKMPDFNSMGLGALSQAFGGAPGTTGKRPWADSPFSSMGGNFLRNFNPPGGI